MTSTPQGILILARNLAEAAVKRFDGMPSWLLQGAGAGESSAQTPLYERKCPLFWASMSRWTPAPDWCMPHPVMVWKTS
jgi:hypothetical protein